MLQVVAVKKLYDKYGQYLNWAFAILAFFAVIAAVGYGLAHYGGKKYEAGFAAATAKFEKESLKKQAEAAERTRKAEQKQQEAFAEKQRELEKEKENAEKSVSNLRGELGRLQQYANDKSKSNSLPKAISPAHASNGEVDTKGWQLFGKCASEYAGMAEVADKQNEDLREWQAYGQAIQTQIKEME